MKKSELQKLIREEIRKAIAEADDSPVSNLLSLLAGPDIKKYMDKLSDVISDEDFMAVKGLYDKLYAELKQHETGTVGEGMDSKPIKSFKVTDLAKIFAKIGFPTTKVEVFSDVNAGPTLSVEFKNTLNDENEFIDAYTNFQSDNGALGSWLPDIQSAYHKGGNKWHFQMQK